MIMDDTHIFLNQRVLKELQRRTAARFGEEVMRLHYYAVSYLMHKEPGELLSEDLEIFHGAPRELLSITNPRAGDALKRVDYELASLPYSHGAPSGSFEESVHVKNIVFAVERALYDDSVFHAYAAALAFFGVFEDFIVVEDVDFNIILDLIAPSYLARRLEENFSAARVSEAREAIKSLSGVPVVDVELLPPYAVESSALIRHGGEWFFVADVLKMMTAAGGAAQALERQDLEPEVTNAGRLIDSTKDSEEDEDDSSSGSK